MTNHNDAKVVSSSSSKPRVKSAKTTGKFSSLITILTFIAIVSSIYALYSNLQTHQNTTQQVNHLVTQINTLKQLQNQTERLVDGNTKAITAAQDALHTKLNTLDKNIHTALQQYKYQTKDWLLLKARYYLELAQINTHWSDNADTTIALLQQADVLLADVHDQRIYKIRQAISKEVLMLKALPKIDIAGLLSQLDAAQDMVGNIELKPSITANQNASTKKKEASPWQERLKESMDVLEKLVVIRRHNEAVLPLPSPAYEAMLRENIRLNLQEAQWAVLQNNETIYQFVLMQALKNINRAFEPNMAITDNLIKQLKNLQSIHLNQQKPILEQSLPLLNQFIELKNSEFPMLQETPHND